MKNLIFISMIAIVQSYAFGSQESDNIFIGKTSPRRGAAATATVIGVDQSVLIRNATANGVQKCKTAGFQYCYAIDDTFDAVQDNSGFYHQIVVEGFHEVPDKYKPKPANRICYLVEKVRTEWFGLSTTTYYEYYTYYKDSDVTSEVRYLDERGDVGLHEYDVRQIKMRLMESGACDEWRDAPAN